MQAPVSTKAKVSMLCMYIGMDKLLRLVFMLIYCEFSEFVLVEVAVLICSVVTSLGNMGGGSSAVSFRLSKISCCSYLSDVVSVTKSLWWSDNSSKQMRSD